MPGTTSVPSLKRKGILRSLITVLAVLLVLTYIGFGALFYFQQDQMAFPAPSQYAKATPADIGIAFEDLHIPVAGSELLHAWWIPAAQPSDQVLLMFHGNGYVLEQAVGQGGEVISLHRLGANLLLLDYRGYGSSTPGIPNETRVYEDARAALSYLLNQRHVGIHNIIFMGRSIGTGPTTQLSVEHPDAGGLILESPFTSLTEAAKGIWYLRAFPLSLFVHNRFDNLSKIGSVQVPVLITVGTEDTLTPPAMANALFREANQPKQLYLVPGADHNDIVKVGGPALESHIRAFVDGVQ
ncbi:MAG TPA: alpha/beta hydrolase [Terriglobales bacterium]|nr:alpha/beta hydrolase [Terriglobales bacterium]